MFEPKADLMRKGIIIIIDSCLVDTFTFRFILYLISVLMRIDGLHELLTEIMMKEFANFSIRKLLIVARGKQGV